MSNERRGYFGPHPIESLDALVEAGADHVDALHPELIIGRAPRIDDAREGEALWNGYIADPTRSPLSKEILGIHFGFSGDPDNISSQREIGEVYGITEQTVSGIVRRELRFIGEMTGVEIPPPIPRPTREDSRNLTKLLREHIGDLDSLSFDVLLEQPVYEIDAVVTTPTQRKALIMQGVVTIDELYDRLEFRPVLEKFEVRRRRRAEIAKIRRQAGEGEPLIVGTLTKTESKSGVPCYIYTSSDGYIINPRLKHPVLNELVYLNIDQPTRETLQEAGYFHIKDLVAGFFEEKNDVRFRNTPISYNILRALMDFLI